MRTRTAALFTIAALSAPVAAQVILSEVRADAGGRWIEIQNRGTSWVDLSAWSLHHATFTPGMPQSYWWPFPMGTSLQPGASTGPSTARRPRPRAAPASTT